MKPKAPTSVPTVSKKPLKAAVYLRVSRDDKDDAGRSVQKLENQLPIIEALISQRNWTSYDIYQDEETGTGRKHRPGFAQMMKDAQAGKFQVLIFWSLDRFSREGPLKTLEDLASLSRWGVDYVSCQEPFLDTPNLGPLKEALIGLWAALAQMESQRMSARIKAGMKRRKEVDKLPIGRKKRDIPEAEMKEMLDRGMSLNQVARALGVSRSTVIRRKGLPDVSD